MVSEIVTLFIGGEGIEREDFRRGLQRVLNRVPRRGSTTEPEFSTYFFLGSVLTLPYTELNGEIGIKSSCVKILPGKKTIKLAFKIKKSEKTKLVFKTITTTDKVRRAQHLTTDEFKEALGSLDLTEDERNNCEVEGEIVHIKNGEVNLKTLEVVGKGELNSEILRAVIRDRSPLPGYNEKTAKFKKVKGGVIEKGSLNNALEQFSDADLKAGEGEKLSPSAKGAEALFENLSKVYRSQMKLGLEVEEEELKKLGLSDYEAPIHGFVYGALAMNFRYEHKLRIRAEQAAGKGFVDLVIGSHGREFRAELKGLRNTAQDAKCQSEREGYDKAPIIFSFGEEQKAKSVTMVFANLCLDPNSGGLLVEESKVPSKPEGLSKLFKEHNDGILDDEGLKRGLKEKLNYLYYSISDSNGGGENTNYLSRLILGELLSDGSGLEKHVFIYGSKEDHVEPTEIVLKDRTVPGEPLVTLANTRGITLVLKFTDDKSLVVNVIENAKFNREKSIPLDGIGINHSKCKQVNIKVNPEANGGFEVKDDKGKSYYQGIEIGGVTSFGNKYEGKLEKIKHVVLQDITDITQVRGFQEALFPLRKLITLENHFQAIVQGLLSAQEGVEVLTEPNYSSKGKPDLLVSRRGEYGRTHVAVVELKLALTKEKIEEKRKEGEDQLNKRANGLETITKEEKVEAAVLVVCPSEGGKDKFITHFRAEDLNVEHSSGGSSDGEPSPERRRCSSERRKRNIGMSCIDSRDEESIEEQEIKEELIKELFDSDEIRERIKNVEFYDQLFKVSDKISKEGTINEDARKALKAKIKDIDLNLIDPEIKGIVAEIKNKISQENANKGLEAILRESGVAEKIGKVAEGAGLAFTVFLVGKHIANGNIEGLGYDALNLLIMPKIGEKISGKILELGTKLNSQMLKGFAPVMGRAIGNFAAFLGLAESIKARQNAKDPVDIKIADLNIATNSIFIAADVPAVVTETMSAIGMEAGVIGEFTGPVGAAVSVAVIVISQFVEAGLEVEKLEEQINLTDQEKHDLYWRFFLGMKIPDYIERDITAKAIYKGYISHIIDSLQGKYDVIAMTLPAIRIKQEKNIHAKDVSLVFISAGAPSTECKSETRITDEELDFALNVNVNLSNVSHTGDYSRVIPDTIKGYDIFCGPRDSDIRTQVVKMHEYNYPSFESCDDYFKDHDDGKESQTTERWFFQKYSPDCNNVAVYSSRGSSEHKSIYCITSQNAKIYPYGNNNSTVAFHGREISVLSPERDRNVSNSTENRYYFSQGLRNCTVHKPGNNFFYITGNEFSCNLKREGQKNIVVTQGNFTDSENIHSIVGNNGTNHIEVSYAGYVDGQGGNDVITAKNSPVIKGYFGDNIHGNGLVLLPMSFSDIDKMTLINNTKTIYSKDGKYINIDEQILIKTTDDLFVTPTKIDNKTKRVTNLHATIYHEDETLKVHFNASDPSSCLEAAMLELYSKTLSKDRDLQFMEKLFSGARFSTDSSGYVSVDTIPAILTLALKGNLMNNQNFKVVKQIFSKGLDVIIGDSSNHIFYADKQPHFFYWEAPDDVSHLYLFDDKNVTAIINKANGLLDFSQVKRELIKPKVEIIEDAVKVSKGGVVVMLTQNYKNATITFDGKEHYKLLQDGKLERDHCSHNLKIDGRFSIDLLGHYNCFTFDSNKVLFLKLNNDLLLLSDKGALSLSDYYSSVHRNWDLSVRLNGRVIEPEEFKERADNPSSFRHYPVKDEQVLTIYHNQPINKHQIGLIDLKDKSILDYNVKIVEKNLLLSLKNGSIYSLIFLRAENWSTYHPAREMMFAFNDTTLFNSKCVVSDCDPKDIIEEFGKETVKLISKKDKGGNTLLHHATMKGELDKVRLLVEKGADVHEKDNFNMTSLDVAYKYKQKEVVRFLLNARGNEDNKQRHRRHHIRHENHHSGHRSPIQEVASSGTRPSSWINDLFGWVKDSVGRLLGSQVALPGTQSLPKESTSNSKPKVTTLKADLSQVDVNGTILLLDTFIRKFTGQKYISSNTRGITEQEALGYVLSVTEKFRKVVEQAALKSGISIHRLNIDFMKMQEEITGKIISGKFNEISEILKSYAEKACPGREAGCSGRLSQKKFDKFMTEFNSIIDPVINQPMQQILSRSSMLKESNIKEQQISLEPKSYLSDTSVQCHLTQDRGLRN